ncbi:MAG: HAD family hydrolase [Paludibacteraceae bacterium]|nr:HAD family hydrolase [Paludibacteraceae bacterium]
MKFELDNIDVVVSDLDGTLYDKRHIAARLIKRDIRHLHYLLSERLARKHLRGKSFGSADAFYSAYFEEMARGRMFTADDARRWYADTYMPTMVDIIRKHYTVQNWVPELIRECKERQVPIVVYSDYDFVSEKLQALHLDEKNFAFVVSAPSLGGLKPSKESAMAIINRLGAKAERTLFLGDRDDTDGGSARAVGAKCQLIKNTDK